MAKKFNIEKFNRLLAEAGQKISAEKISTTEISLSNGVILTSNNEIKACKRRVMNGERIWLLYFDRLYSLDYELRLHAEKKCKSNISRKGGINCQKIHGDKIRSNLNTGIPWNKDTKGNYPYSVSCSPETKKKIGNANSGSKNGMFGTTLSADRKKQNSDVMKELILSGKFTPNSNNRNTHWNSYYKNIKYRSSWEALYQYHDNDAVYEELRIPYQFNGVNHIYIVDFINHKTKRVVEVKPKNLLSDQKTQQKIMSAKQWCAKNGYDFLIADDIYLRTMPFPKSLDNFDIATQTKIRKLYETC